MGRISDSFVVLYVGLAAAVYFMPEETFHRSKAATIAQLFATITTSKLIYQLFLYPQYFTPLKNIKTPGGRHWWCGNTQNAFLETPYDSIRDWVKAFPGEGLIRFYVVGNLERVIPTSTKALSELLVTKVYDFEKPRTVRQGLRRLVGDGIILAEGEEHKFQRKNLMPAFAYRHIKDLYPIFWAKSSEMVKLIREDLASRKPGDDNTIQIRNWASRTTLDIIGVAGMDQDFDSLRHPENNLNQAYMDLLAPPDLFAKVLFMIGLFLGNMKVLQKIPTKRNKRITEGGNIIRNVASQMIRQKKAKMEDPTAETGIDIISVAMRNGTFDEENLVDQLMTFLGAGHETTATAMQWAVYALSKNPEVQTRLREEIHASLPPVSVENPQPISAALIDSLPYLHAVCNEVLRFYPAVPTTIRVASRDTTLVGNHIPKDTFLVISPEIINHLENLWGPDADTFNPDRFLGEGKGNSGGATSNYANLTFLHGPRSCIGQGFAKAELACLLAVFVGSFEFELKYPDAKLELREGGATVSPRDGVLAKLTPL
ncbi:hypothetical protein N7492_005857 [Penicillium capsulatum]|uniref:Cytochrome P450 n=1 Tax=Penicillium capsulatum TaxID=69766 RepID=A0A9W9IA83_9EURO|nr:hypothetical protein N7492_005857 [Penicillium capsulatum]KAJ6135041.1 hypothetical protein N7512_000201 [Penicillium capsulatum]